MASRKSTLPEAEQGIPRDLYWGLLPWAFPAFAEDHPRFGEGTRLHRTWTRAVRDAGFTVRTLRRRATTDPGYQGYLERERRRQFPEEYVQVIR